MFPWNKTYDCGVANTNWAESTMYEYFNLTPVQIIWVIDSQDALDPT